MRKLMFIIAFLFMCIFFAFSTGEKEPTITTDAERTGEYGEAPMLAALVAEGKLPPVEERLPEEPKVKDRIEEIGRYGGELQVFGIVHSSEGGNDDMDRLKQGSALLLDLTMEGELVGDLAKDYALSADEKSTTLYLREGAKWSDGFPFTADDIVFMFVDMVFMDNVQNWTPTIAGMKVEKIDDYTVRFTYPDPNPGAAMSFSGWAGHWITSSSPKHYVKKWHIRYNPEADKLAKEEGFDNWYEAFNWHQWFNPTNDLKTPTMLPWAPKENTGTVKVYERNAYYYQVDPRGNQLPYIDTVVVTNVDGETYQLKIISGEADYAYTHTSLPNYPLYKENEEEGGYRTLLYPGTYGAQVAFGLNQNHEDPFLREVFQDIRFRQAMSVAIDREEINDTIYHGLAVPRQATTPPSTIFYKEEWGEKHPYTKYDPDLANDLLDEMGLTKRDSDGFRVDPKGNPIILLVEWKEAHYPDPTELELVKEYWEDVGLKTLLKPSGTPMIDLRWAALDHVVAALPYGETNPYFGDFRAGVTGNNLKQGPAWAKWLNANNEVETGMKTLADFEDGVLPGEEPPEHVKQQFERRQRARVASFPSEEYIKLAQEIYDYWAEGLYAIGTVGLAPKPLIANKNLGGVSLVLPLTGWGQDFEAQQFFWKK